MNLTIRHLVAIDRALAEGLTLELEGRAWTFSPPDFGDYAELLAYHKSRDLTTYLDATVGKPVDQTTRARDIIALASRSPRDEDFSLSNPLTLIHKAWLSLRHKHPDVTRREVVDLLSKDENRERIAVAMGVLEATPQGVYDTLYGKPQENAILEAGKSGPNPTP